MASTIAPVIAVDAMGGDQAPAPEVAGAVAAVRDHGAQVILLGDEPRLRAELRRLRATDLPIAIRPCAEVITMEDHPAQAARKLRDSSMRVAFELVRSGAAQAVVSAGNSGAMMACGLLVLGRLRGVDRPGILVTVPALDQHGTAYRRALLDVGANVDCKPGTLAQLAVLGATFARLRHAVAGRPRVALLSNGEEPSKGTALLRRAHALLSRPVERDFDYCGYIEGHELFRWEPAGQAGVPGRCPDVVVTDGFSGNLVLKTAEGTARIIGQLFRRRVRQSVLARLGALLMLPQLRAMEHLIDVERRGGAPLLGVAGVVIICHGRSSPRAIASAIALACEQAQAGLSPALAAAIERHQPLWAPAATGDPAPADAGAGDSIDDPASD